ncbi:unnamed protein product, partial [Rodentolepis nana]|uniref:KH_dom_type_1 domain-containing protein n=1 Tax=Rodentolepis nana TaxID=102285 RepID=A0A0R3TM28_RODNA
YYDNRKYANHTAVTKVSSNIIGVIGRKGKILADEPSIALYRIQEHIRKTAPGIAEGRVTFPDCSLNLFVKKRALVFSEKLQSTSFDLDNSSEYDFIIYYCVFLFSAIATFSNARTNLEDTLKILEASMKMHPNIIESVQDR